MRIEAKGIRKDFIRKGRGTNIHTAVDECDLLLREGKVTVIRGRSGSGKSTLLNMLSGILKPDAGVVTYDKQDLYAMDDANLSAFRNRHIGYIPQGSSAISSLNILENILLPWSLKKNQITKEQILKDAQELMEETAITHLATEKPAHLSGGELRRMAIARALLLRPEVVLADEPTGDLDDENTEIVFRMLQKTAKAGVSVVIVTHEENAKEYADDMYRMDAGKLIKI